MPKTLRTSEKRTSVGAGPALTHLRKDFIGGVAIVAVAVVMFRVFPDNLSFLTGMIAMMLLVISLDLVSGVGGIATLGHGVLFGAGAYAAGIAASNGTGVPRSPSSETGNATGDWVDERRRRRAVYRRHNPARSWPSAAGVINCVGATRA